MVVLSALPARDTDTDTVPANNHTSRPRNSGPRNTTNGHRQNTAAADGPRWSVRNFALLSSFGGSTAAAGTTSGGSKDSEAASAPAASSPHSSPPPAAVDRVSEIHPVSSRKAKQRQPRKSAPSAGATESNRSLETANTSSTSSSAWSSGTFEYAPSDDSSSSSSSSSASTSFSPKRSTFLQTYENMFNDTPANMRPKSTKTSGSRRRPSTSSTGSSSERRRGPGTADEVVRAIAQSASSLGIAASTTHTAEAGTGASSSSSGSTALPRLPVSSERSVSRTTSDGSGGGGGKVIHARIRRRYSNPNLPNMAAAVASTSASSSSLSSSVAHGTSINGSSGGISASAATRMPRRSSLKKVSSYGPEAERRSSIGSSRRRTAATTLPTSASSAAGLRTSRRRHSMVDLTSAGHSSGDTRNNNQEQDNNSSTNDLRNHRRTRRSTSLPTIYKEVTFDSSVSYATISYVHDICPRAPERLFYVDEDYARMKGEVRSDAKQIKLETKKRQEQTEQNPKQEYNSGKYMDGTSRNIKTSSYLPSCDHDDYDNDELEQSDTDLCNWGIEHHTCSKAERQERSERARSVINAVLWKQSTIRQSKSASDLRNPDLVDTITSKLARTSIKASQVARIQAVERATRVEFHCSKIIDRRHSEGDAKYGARILDGLSDSEDEDMKAGGVKDASLDKTVGRRRPAYRRRASLA